MMPLTRAALEDLRERCTFNYLRSFVFDDEKKSAVDVLRALHYEAGQPLDPREIESWASGVGWNEKDAKLLREIAAGVIDHRKFYAYGKLIRYDPARARVMVESWRKALAA